MRALPHRPDLPDVAGGRYYTQIADALGLTGGWLEVEKVIQSGRCFTG